MSTVPSCSLGLKCISVNLLRTVAARIAETEVIREDAPSEHDRGCYGPFQKNCNILSIFRWERGLWKRGQPPFAGTARRVLRTNGVCPFSFPCVTSIVLQFFCDEPYRGSVK